MKGQLSAEMIILAAVLLAVVAIVAVGLTNTAKKAGGELGNQSESILNRTRNITGDFSAVPVVPGQDGFGAGSGQGAFSRFLAGQALS